MRLSSDIWDFHLDSSVLVEYCKDKDSNGWFKTKTCLNILIMIIRNLYVGLWWQNKISAYWKDIKKSIIVNLNCLIRLFRNLIQMSVTSNYVELVMYVTCSKLHPKSGGKKLYHSFGIMQKERPADATKKLDIIYSNMNMMESAQRSRLDFDQGS